MAKFSFKSKLSREERRELLLEFCEAIVSIRTPEEALDFLQDLLSHQEVEMLAKRIRIARLLLDGKSYSEISELLKVSYGTIARVSEWLKVSGEGYRIVVERTKGKTQSLKATQSARWIDLKKRYPMYYWPQLLLEDLIRNANRRQRQKVERFLKTLDKKSKLYQDLSRALRAV